MKMLEKLNRLNKLKTKKPRTRGAPLVGATLIAGCALVGLLGGLASFGLIPASWAQVPMAVPFGFFGTRGPPPTPFGDPVPGLGPACTNGTVNAIADVGNNRVVIGGDFTMVGPCTGMGVPIDSSSGTPSVGFNQATSTVHGRVNAAIPDGTGGFYIGGDFTRVGSNARYRVARVNATGQLDLAFVPNLGFNGAVSALALNAGTLYVGGSFAPGPSYGGAIDADGVAPLGHYGEGAFNGTISVSISDGSGGWYVGGNFTTYRGIPVARLAHINADGSLDTGLMPNPDATMRALLLDGTTLYLGGSFTRLAGVTRQGVGAVRTSLGVATAMNGGTFGVNTISKLPSGTIAIGGSLSAVGSASAGYREEPQSTRRQALQPAAGLW